MIFVKYEQKTQKKSRDLFAVNNNNNQLFFFNY